MVILKSRKVVSYCQVNKPGETLLAYGSTTPLEVKGSFETDIKANDRSERSTVYVITGGSRNLLVQERAIEIPIDDSLKPVSQPYRRIPIPIVEKIEQKVKELLDSDIIEEVREPSK